MTTPKEIQAAPPLMPRFGLGDIVTVTGEYAGDWRNQKLMIVGVLYEHKRDLLTYATVPADAPLSEGMTTDWDELSLSIYSTNKFNTRPIQSHAPEASTVDADQLKRPVEFNRQGNQIINLYNDGYNDAIDELLRRGFRQEGGKGDAINALSICSATGSRWMHVKSTREYVIIGSCRLEHSASPAYLYRDEAGVVWARDKDEFLDGRFVRIDTPQPEHDKTGVSDMGIPALVLDEREIASVHKGGDYQTDAYTVGRHGVTKIEAYKEHGEYDYLPFIAIFKCGFSGREGSSHKPDCLL